MPPPTISLSLLRFENGPLMSESSGSVSADTLAGDQSRPIEFDFMLSMIAEPQAMRITPADDTGSLRQAG